MSVGPRDANALGVQPAAAGERLRDSSAALPAPGVARPKAAALASAGAKTRGRLPELDAARVVATAGVMWTHVAEMQGHRPAWAALGRFGTSFYVAAAVFLAVRSALAPTAPPLEKAIRQRARRLLVPFALWSLIYAVFYFAITRPVRMRLSEVIHWWGPFAGTARHLWFLPFAAFAGTLAFWAAPKVRKMSRPRLLLVGTLATVVTYWLFYRHLFFALNRFWAIDWHLHRMDRWIEEIPLVVASLFASVWLLGDPPATTTTSGAPAREARHPASSTYAAVTLGAAFVACEFFYQQGFEFIDLATHSEGRFVANVAGLLLLAAFLELGPRRFLVSIAPLGRLTYFAFLSHVLLLDWLNVHVSGQRAYGTLWFSALCTLGLLALSMAIGALAARTRVLRWLIP